MTGRWDRRLAKLTLGLQATVKAFAEANIEAVRNASKGMGPDASSPDPKSGMRYVVNISSAHVPAFCSDNYKNGYDLGKFRIGATAKNSKPKTRELVDEALPTSNPSNVYFGAASLGGTGIRFYGDICLVLKGDKIPSSTYVLDRNSYDLVRKPFSTLTKGKPARLKAKARSMSAQWGEVEKVAAIKAMSQNLTIERRMTSGQIAMQVLNDEDYIEILKEGTFFSTDIETALISSEEAAAVNHIEFRQKVGPAANAADLLFARQRRKAIEALEDHSVMLMVSTTSGRIK